MDASRGSGAGPGGVGFGSGGFGFTLGRGGPSTVQTDIADSGTCPRS
jgi:hypothetical protein